MNPAFNYGYKLALDYAGGVEQLPEKKIEQNPDTIKNQIEQQLLNLKTIDPDTNFAVPGAVNAGNVPEQQ